MLKSTYQIPRLPPTDDLETKEVLRAAARAHRHLAELKGCALSIPNQGILIDTLSLQEAKASSEIENIVTTFDELFRTSSSPLDPASPAAKEVAFYRDALKLGSDELAATDGLITNNTIIKMFRVLKRRTDGFRATPGTALKNENSGEIVYVPPQEGREIISHMGDLEKFVNENDMVDLDPLIKMALIHHQFESIHPFPDGNGRIGRIINVLYLQQQNLLNAPILYLSRFITQNKADYYSLLQETRVNKNWQPWILFMLQAIEETSIETLSLINEIKVLMAAYKQAIRSEHQKIYSQDLLNNLFRYPYTRIDFLASDLSVTRQTAAKQLDQLAEAGLLEKYKSGRNNYYINFPLVALFSTVHK